ncbi:DnaJ domain-containing protein [Flammeovirga pacifica]|uniref:J domain-containing protein n=1 Tax=Flammeovirga pacifica TaxID=915059 RepID=A0A1S1YWQ5_FLAPC|nr:DnaJ domain-containing protein [Flammeovirga pacifica]OHX65265.1 hypothetical protein NH26_02300 [Flammeovirga pacifica]
MRNNYYDILGIDQQSDKRQIKKAYLSLAKKFHPDIHGNDPEKSERFKIINEAYETLSDESKKFHYDHGISVTSFTNETYTDTVETQYKTQKREEYAQEKKEFISREKKTNKLFVPLTVGAFTVVIAGLISFFVQRQSKLAATTYEDAKLNLELRHDAIVKEQIEFLHQHESPILADIITAGLYINIDKSNNAIDILEPQLFKINEQDKKIASDAYCYLGIAYYKRKLGNKAIGYLEKSISYNPNNTAVYYWLGLTYSELKLDYQRAIQSLEKSKNTLGYENKTILNLGIAYQNAKQFNAAKDQFTVILHDPTYKKEANYYMGWNYFLDQRDVNRACLFWETAAKLGSKEGRYQVQRHCGN